MNVGLCIVIAIFILIQLGTSYAWIETDVLEQFSRTFGAFYDGELPYWTKIAFSGGYFWYAVSAFLTGVFIASIIYKSIVRLLYFTLFLSMGIVGAMWYAMYPLHIMLSGTTI